MSTTSSIAQEPRVSNGTEAPVETDPTKVTSLTQEQQDELAAAREAKANGGSVKRGKNTTTKTTGKVSAAKTPKAKTQADTGKNDLLAALRAIRGELKNRNDGEEKGTPDFSKPGSYLYDEFIVAVEASMARGKEAIALARKLQKAEQSA